MFRVLSEPNIDYKENIRFYNPVAKSLLVLWNPSLISPLLWLDASDSSSITISSGVSQWNDKSGNNRNFSQSTSGNRPTVSDNSLNNLATIRFAGSPQQFLSGGDILNLLTDTRDYFLVGKVASSNSIYQTFWSKTNSAWTAGSGLIVGQSGSNTLTSIFGSTHQSLSYTNLNFNIVRTKYNYSTKQLGSSFNGNALTNVSVTWSSSLSNTLNFLLGIYHNSSNSPVSAALNGNIAEFIVANNLSSDDAQKIEGYLAHKWGLTANLPSGHPYKSFPPQV